MLHAVLRISIDEGPAIADRSLDRLVRGRARTEAPTGNGCIAVAAAIAVCIGILFGIIELHAGGIHLPGFALILEGLADRDVEIPGLRHIRIHGKRHARKRNGHKGCRRTVMHRERHVIVGRIVHFQTIADIHPGTQRLVISLSGGDTQIDAVGVPQLILVLEGARRGSQLVSGHVGHPLGGNLGISAGRAKIDGDREVIDQRIIRRS